MPRNQDIQNKADALLDKVIANAKELTALEEFSKAIDEAILHERKEEGGAEKLTELLKNMGYHN